MKNSNSEKTFIDVITFRIFRKKYIRNSTKINFSVPFPGLVFAFRCAQSIKKNFKN